jgi:hypothetical protein
VPSTSITATTRSSVERGVEAVGVAAGALASVRDEAASLLGEEDGERVAARYAERLLRSDLAAHVARALDRGDPEIERLFDANARFVGDLPARYVTVSDALARNILEPPLRRWHRVREPARAAYWRLFETALRADPGVPGKGSGPLAVLGLRFAAADHRTRAAALLMAARVATAIRRRLPLRRAGANGDAPG